MFNTKSRHLSLVAPSDTQTYGIAKLARNLHFDWECGGERAIRGFFRYAFPGTDAMEADYGSNPVCLVPLFTEARPLLERYLEKTSGGSNAFCSKEVLKLLESWQSPGTANLDGLTLHRATAIVISMGVDEGVRELLIAFMRRPDITSRFGFEASAELAKLRKGGRLYREELVSWKDQLVASTASVPVVVLADMLGLIEKHLSIESVP